MTSSHEVRHCKDCGIELGPMDAWGMHPGYPLCADREACTERMLAAGRERQHPPGDQEQPDDGSESE